MHNSKGLFAACAVALSSGLAVASDHAAVPIEAIERAAVLAQRGGDLLAERVDLELPGMTLGLRVERRDTALVFERGRMYRGSVEGVGGRFVLAEVDGAVAGAVWTPQGVLELRSDGGFDRQGRPTVEVVNIDELDLPGCGLTDDLVRLQQEDDARLARRGGDEVGGAQPGVEGTAGSDPAGEVRVLIVIGPAAQSQMGGFAASQARALAAVAATNDAYARSVDNPLELIVSGIVPLAESESGRSGSTLLNNISFTDGVYDDIAARRDQSASDLVAMLAPFSSQIGVCGVAWLGINSGASRGFSVTAHDCAVGGLTFAHELGHNYGAAHDRDNAGGGFTSYAFGHRWTGTDGVLYRSIMSYAPGSRAPVFSNPDVNWGGTPSGVVNSEDNGRLHALTAPSVANFRVGTGTAGTDCDGNGEDDFVQVLQRPGDDLNENGIPDDCDLQNGLLADCDGDGSPDIRQTNPYITLDSGFLPLTTSATGAATRFEAGSVLADSRVDLRVEMRGAFFDARSYRLRINGNSVTLLPAVSTFSCTATDPFTLSVNFGFWNDLADGEDQVVVTLEPSSLFGGVSCPQVRITAEYRGYDPAVDSNADGIPDTCLTPPCSIADVASAFGSLDVNDVIEFINAFNAGDEQGGLADVSPPGGDGLLNVNDVIDFVAGFNAGCP